MHLSVWKFLLTLAITFNISIGFSSTIDEIERSSKKIRTETSDYYEVQRSFQAYRLQDIQKHISPQQHFSLSDIDVPLDMYKHIFSYLTDQKDLLRAGSVCQVWRKAVNTHWRKKELRLSFSKLTNDDFITIEHGPFIIVNLAGNNSRNRTGVMQNLTVLTTTISLDLSWNRIRTQELFYIKNLTQLNCLNLKCNQIDGSNLNDFCLFKNLIFLDLSYNPIKKKNLIYLQSLTKLKDLSLCSTDINNEDLVHLEKLRELTSVDLSRNNITAQGIMSLTSLINLNNMNLDHNKIMDEGIYHLQHLKNLKILCLSNNEISSVGLIHLQPLEKLNHLYLSGNKINFAGLYFLKSLTQLKTLYLMLNSISNEEEAYIRQIFGKIKVML